MAAWWLSLCLAAPVPLWVTFDVVNPAVVGGHRVLHLEDIIGPDQRRDIAGLPAASAVLLFSARPDECGASGLCAEVSRWTFKARHAGAVVIALILAERDRADSIRARLVTSRLPIAIALDAHGVIRALSGLDQPGSFVVIDDKGRTRRWTPSSGRATVSPRELDEIRAALEQAALPLGG